MVEKICVGLLISICSITDVRNKKISIRILCIFAVIALLLMVIQPSMPLINYFCGAGVGLLIWIISRYSKESIGRGDAYLIMVTGLFLGALVNLYLILGATLICMIYSIVLLMRKYRKEYEIPFVPFLLVSYMGFMIYEKIG